MPDTEKKQLQKIKNQTQNQLNQLQKADQQLFNHRTQAAIQILKRIIQRNHPEKQHQILGWGSVAQQKSCYEKSIIEWYRQQRSEKKELVTAYDCLCLYFTINKNYQNSKQYYKKMLHTYPQNKAFSLYLAHINFNSGQIKQAKRIYQQLLKSQKQKKHAIKQLAILAFYEDNQTEVLLRLQQLKQNAENDYTLKFLEAYTASTPQQQLTLYDELISKYPFYARSYFFKAYTLESLDRIKEAHQCYVDCTKKNRKYSIPYIEIAFSYIQQNKIQEAINILQSSSNFKWDDDVLIDFLLIFAYFRKGQIEESIKNVRKFIKAMQNKPSPLKATTKLFFEKFFQKFFSIVEKQQNNEMNALQKSELIDKWYDSMLELHSIKQQPLSVRVQKIIQKNLQVVQVIKFYFSNGEQLDKALEEKIYSSNIEQEYSIQLTNSLLMKFIKNEVSCQKRSLVQLYKDISSFLVYIANQNDNKTPTLDNTKYQRDESLRVYTTKYKPKKYNLFQQKQYFKGFQHLFLTLKKFRAQVKITKKLLEQMINQIFSAITPKQHKLYTRFDSSSLEIAIIQIMLDLFPQVGHKKMEILQHISKKLKKAQNLQFEDLILAFRSQIQIQFERIIKERLQKKTATTCFISNWVQLWLFFDNKKKVIEAIQLITQKCKDNSYQIHEYQGDLYLNYQSTIVIRIKIGKVCSTLYLVLNKKHSKSYLKSYAKTMISFNLSPILKTFIDFKRKNKHSLGQYFEQHLEFEEKNTAYSEQQKVILHKVKLFSRQIRHKNQKKKQEQQLIERLSYQNNHFENNKKRTKNYHSQVIAELREQLRVQDSINQISDLTRRRIQFEEDESDNGAETLNQTLNETLNQSYQNTTLKKSHNRLQTGRFKVLKNQQLNMTFSGRLKELIQTQKKPANNSKIVSNSLNILINQMHQSKEQSDFKQALQRQKLQLTLNIQELERNLEIAKNENHQVSQNITKQLTLNQIQKCQITNLQAQNYDLKQKCAQKDQQFDQIKDKLKIVSTKNERMQQEANSFTEQINLLQEKCKKLEEQLQITVQKSINSTKQLSKQLQQQISKEKFLSNSIQELRLNQSSILRELQAQRNKYAQKQSQILNLLNVIESYKSKEQQLKTQIDYLKSITILRKQKEQVEQELKRDERDKNHNQTQTEVQNPKNKELKIGKITCLDLQQSFQDNHAKDEDLETKKKVKSYQSKKTTKKDYRQNASTNHLNQKQLNEQINERVVQRQNTKVQIQIKSQPFCKQHKCYQGSYCKNAKSLKKKVQYLKILFIILLFQAITLTFTTKFFK